MHTRGRHIRLARAAFAACVAFAAFAVPTSAFASPDAVATTPTIVLLRPDVDPVAKVAQYGVTARYVYTHAAPGFAADLSVADQSRLAHDPDVMMVTPDRRHSYAGSTLANTRLRGTTIEGASPGVSRSSATGATPIEAIPQIAARGFRRIGGLENDTVRVDGVDDRLDVDIALLDSGIQADQPDLRVMGGVDCADSTGNWNDVEGHGTIVAGVAAAIDNSFGIVGVAAGARLWSVRVLDSTLSGEDSAVLCGIDWVTAHASTIEVANMSLGGPGTDDGHCGLVNHDPIHFAICQSVKAGVVNVAAAGNDAVDVAGFIPAAYREVIATSGLVDSDGLKGGKGAPDPCEGFPDDHLAPFSNWGKRIDIAAPAVCVSSTYIGSDVAVDTGTSYASPFVSGAAALFVASHAGRKLYRSDASPQRRVEAVRSAILKARERTHLPGDPDRWDEGVLSVRRF